MGTWPHLQLGGESARSACNLWFTSFLAQRWADFFFYNRSSPSVIAVELTCLNARQVSNHNWTNAIIWFSRVSSESNFGNWVFLPFRIPPQDPKHLKEFLLKSEGHFSKSEALLLCVPHIIPLQAPVSQRHRSLECRCAAETHITLKPYVTPFQPPCLPSHPALM